MSGCQPWAPGWTWPGHQWRAQQHPWADLDPLGRDRGPLPALGPLQRVLAPAYRLRPPCVCGRRGAYPDSSSWWARAAYAAHLAAVLPRFPEPDSPPPAPQALPEILKWSAQQMRDRWRLDPDPRWVR